MTNMQKCAQLLDLSSNNFFTLTFWYRCIEFGRPVLCYNTFFRCQNASGRRTHSLCKRDCELFKNVYCKKELEMIAMEKGILSLYIPQCDELPHSDELCISISIDSNGSK